MPNFEEPAYKKRKEAASPFLSCRARVRRSETLFKPRVIALQREEPKSKEAPLFNSRAIALQREEAKFKPVEEAGETCPLSQLPDDVALSCLALLSRSDHAALSHLSKRCRSLVASPELYKIRSLMGRTETHVYVCLRTPPDPNPRWYILLRRKETSSDLISISIPWFPCQSPEGSSVVALDWGIYVIGGLAKGNPVSDVLLLDCRTHTWRQAPSMGVARASAAAAVLDGKIYVLGGCEWDDYTLSWGEVFDPKTQTWESLPEMPFRFRKKKRELLESIHGCVVRDGKVYSVNESEQKFYYSPTQGKWGEGNRSLTHGVKRDWCIIGNFIYALNRFGEICWCQKDELDQGKPKKMNWTRVVNGLEALKDKLSCSRVVHFGQHLEDFQKKAQLVWGSTKLLPLVSSLPRGRLTNCDGNILLFWDQMDTTGALQICCAEISLEIRQGGQIWGNIDWSHPVMTYAPRLDHFKILYNVSVTL